MKMAVRVRPLSIGASIQSWHDTKAGVTAAIYGFTLQGISQEEPDGRDTESKGFGGRVGGSAQSVRALPGRVTLPAPPCVHLLGRSPVLVSQDLQMVSCVCVWGGLFFRAVSFFQKGAL